MALPVPADRHRGLHGGQVVPDPPLHGGPLRAGVGPHGGRGLLLPPGGDRAREARQAADLGHGGPGALQVSACGGCVRACVRAWGLRSKTKWAITSKMYFVLSITINKRKVEGSGSSPSNS